MQSTVYFYPPLQAKWSQCLSLATVNGYFMSVGYIPKTSTIIITNLHFHVSRTNLIDMYAQKIRMHYILFLYSNK